MADTKEIIVYEVSAAELARLRAEGFTVIDGNAEILLDEDDFVPWRNGMPLETERWLVTLWNARQRAAGRPEADPTPPD